MGGWLKRREASNKRIRDAKRRIANHGGWLKRCAAVEKIAVRSTTSYCGCAHIGAAHTTMMKEVRNLIRDSMPTIGKVG
jgi:hypothetical protein